MVEHVVYQASKKPEQKDAPKRKRGGDELLGEKSNIIVKKSSVSYALPEK